MDENLVLVVGALHSSKEGDLINNKKLITNLRNCCKSVETSLQNLCSENKSESNLKDQHSITLFREHTLLAVLMCCPCIRVLNEVHDDPQLQMLVSAVPSLADDVFGLVVRALNYQKFVYPALAHFSGHATSCLMKPCFESVIGTVLGPGMLSLITEFSKALLYSVQFEEIKLDSMELFAVLIQILQKYEKDLTITSHRNSAYFFLHLLELLYILSSFLVENKIEAYLPAHTYLHLEMLRKNSRTDIYILTRSIQEVLEHATLALLDLCKSITTKITIDIWMSWAEIDPVDSFFCTNTARVDTQIQVTVQLLICFVASKFLHIFKGCIMQNDSTCSIETTSSNLVKGNIYSTLTKNVELHHFLKQIAVDPNFDTDLKLSFEEILSMLSGKINEANEELDRPSSHNKKIKLINLLVNWYDSAELFCSEEAAAILSRESGCVNKNGAHRLLLTCFELSKQTTVSIGWKMCVLEVSQALDAYTLHRAFLQQIQGGVPCQDWLYTPLYGPHLTTMCNTISATTPPQQHLLWWLCLQRPRSTVASLVQRAVTGAGLASAVATVLGDLALVCGAVADGDSLSILNSILREYLTEPNQLTDSKHRVSFIELFDMLCKLQGCSDASSASSTVTTQPYHHASPQHSAAPASPKHSATPASPQHSAAPIPPQHSAAEASYSAIMVPELLHAVLLPALHWPADGDISTIEVVCAMMQSLLRNRLTDTVYCLRSGADIAACLLSLLTALRNCHAQLSVDTDICCSTTNASIVLDNEAAQQLCYSDGSPTSSDVMALEDSNGFSSAITSNMMGITQTGAAARSSSQWLHWVLLLRTLRGTVVSLVQCLADRGDRQQITWLLKTITSQDPLLPSSCIVLLQSLLPVAENIQLQAQPALTPGLHALQTKPAVLHQLLLLEQRPSRCTDDSERHRSARRHALQQHVMIWSYEDWVSSLVQVLHCSPQEDWVAACAVMRAAPLPTRTQALDHTSTRLLASAAVLEVLRDALHLSCLLQCGHNCSLCYINFNAAAAHLLKEEVSQLPGGEGLLLLYSTFVWWCKSHVVASDTDADLSCVLLVRVLELLGELALSGQLFRRTKENKCGKVSGNSGSPSYITSPANVTSLLSSKVVKDFGGSCGDRSTGTEVVSDLTSFVKKVANSKDVTTALTQSAVKNILENLIEPLVKYAPPCNLRITAATKLKVLVDS